MGLGWLLVAFGDLVVATTLCVTQGWSGCRVHTQLKHPKLLWEGKKTPNNPCRSLWRGWKGPDPAGLELQRGFEGEKKKSSIILPLKSPPLSLASVSLSFSL